MPEPCVTHDRLCLDCLAIGAAAPAGASALGIAPAAASRCAKCASPRLIRHHELFDLTIAHLDCDAFYAAIEKRDRPELADKAVIVGGGRRGVVSTACYQARLYGVHSAMPMFKALKACPHAVVLKPDMQKYAAVGRQIRALMEDITPMVEPLSIDEAFLDLTGTERLHKQPAALTLAKLARKIERRIGITVSIGLSFNKFLAKVASDLNKPRGFTVLGRTDAAARLGAMPVSKIWGVGEALKTKLEGDGIRTIADLQSLDMGDLIKRYGEIGTRLARLSHGEDNRTVSPQRRAKSLSSETTFQADQADPSFLDRTLWRQCETVSRRAKAKQLAGKTITLKLKTSRFSIRTRSASVRFPTNFAGDMYEILQPLLQRQCDGTAFRLLGVGLSNLTSDPAFQSDGLFDEREKQHSAECAIDRVREKFGDQSIVKGRSLKR